MKYYTEPSREIRVAAENGKMACCQVAATQVSAPPCTQHAWDEKRC